MTKRITELARELLELQTWEYWEDGKYLQQGTAIACALQDLGLYTMIRECQTYVSVYISDTEIITDNREGYQLDATWTVRIRKLGNQYNPLVRILRRCMVPKPSYKILYRNGNSRVFDMRSVDTTRLVLALVVGPDSSN